MKWTSVLDEKGCDDSNRDSTDEGQTGKKKKKRKAKKKKLNSLTENGSEGLCENSGSDWNPFACTRLPLPVALCRGRFKHQYDELVKCHKSKKLTLPRGMDCC
ncbi:hypothetical protein QN277_003314 [Acacia crassicarpa]|uniref:Uncharacterized protein n=1 Tax=Acacia crassicarpa TaxID=499986 RepID=A0AAE1JVK0_9FABA|nr:hypothetical protein QN277_003314 [Acacia crassicarpa]